MTGHIRKKPHMRSASHVAPGEASRVLMASIITIVGGAVILVTGAFSALATVMAFTASGTSSSPSIVLGQFCSSVAAVVPNNETATLYNCETAIGIYYFIAIACGIIVIWAGLGMHTNDYDRLRRMSGIALAFSMASILGGGGLLIGLALGVIGGLVGATSRPS